MKINLSLLSKVKSFIGFQVEHSGYLKKDDNGRPVLVRTIDISAGFLFGWITLTFDSGGQIGLDEINKSLREDVMNGKTIQ